MPYKRITVVEAAKQARCTTQTIYNAIRAGDIKASKERRYARLVTTMKREDVTKWIAGRKRAAEKRVRLLRASLAVVERRAGVKP